MSDAPFLWKYGRPDVVTFENLDRAQAENLASSFRLIEGVVRDWRGDGGSLGPILVAALLAEGWNPPALSALGGGS